MSRSAPQGLKPVPIASPVGTAEAVPFPKIVPSAKAASLAKPWIGLLPKVLALMIATSLLSPLAVASHKDKNKIPALRWVEGNPGCTFSRDDDGKYRYGLWSDEAGVVMAVDSQEL